VTRKRDFRPTNCYVEVEFSEPAPGFGASNYPKTESRFLRLRSKKKLPNSYKVRALCLAKKVRQRPLLTLPKSKS